MKNRITFGLLIGILLILTANKVSIALNISPPVVLESQNRAKTSSTEINQLSTNTSTTRNINAIIPEISCRDTIIYLDKNGEAHLTADNVTQIVSGDKSQISLHINKMNFSWADIGKHKITSTATIQTNSTTCISIITVLDTIAPIFIGNSLDLRINKSEITILSTKMLSNLVFDACGISSIKPAKAEFTCVNLGVNSILVQATDSSFNTSEKTIRINIIADKQKPQATNDSIITLQEMPVTINTLANDKAIDGAIDSNSLRIVKQPKHGRAEIITNEINYTPSNGFVGIDNFEYSICDDGIACISLCDTASVRVEVRKHNIAPTAVDDRFISGCEQLRANVLDNDYDMDGHQLSVKTTLVSKAEYGVVSILENGEFTYEFAKGFTGIDHFTYQICDDAYDAKCNQATVFITIFPDNDCDNIDDFTDIDDDNDGILDDFEGNGKIDTDHDGYPDSKDIDSDNDGILDNTEAQEEGNFIPYKGTDINKDGLDDAFNSNNSLRFIHQTDETPDSTSANQSNLQSSEDKSTSILIPVDTDNDGTPDFRDSDSDNDHIPDYIEGYDDTFTGIPTISPSNMDDDQDGLDNAYDNIIAHLCETAFTNPIGGNEILQDFDRGKLRDWRDNDDDDDGILTEFEDLNNDGLYFNDDTDIDGHPEYLDIKSDCTLFIPEGFSPDGDGVHDYFQIYCIKSYPNAKLSIFDRQGTQLYTKEHYGNIDFWGSDDDSWWNGTATMGPNTNEKVTSGIYLYIFEFGNGKSQRGFVMISY